MPTVQRDIVMSRPVQQVYAGFHASRAAIWDKVMHVNVDPVSNATSAATAAARC